MMLTVRCEDGKVRHAPFDTQRAALDWAEWGHVCTSVHSIDSTCQWFALCDELATTTTRHPVLGDVATCQDHHDFATEES